MIDKAVRQLSALFKICDSPPRRRIDTVQYCKDMLLSTANRHRRRKRRKHVCPADGEKFALLRYEPQLLLFPTFCLLPIGGVSYSLAYTRSLGKLTT
ncbi:hypothetical protein M514_04117 [Trichuris suis]|uniref:Uncharacterized protein n=1 Tax=Trichuris suis TaxID=68888 RepID=A0A085NG16_9BILA|nr:hypothetical protein M513_04117 [Trichuris suis]KFD68412.1 hypothetical protein M514_04117 [Trichuris suis]